MHVAIIMDGNGRWAEQRGLKRIAGHKAGARAVRRVVEGAARSTIDCLTLYAFSSDNWRRPRDEVAHLMRLFRRYLLSEISRCVDNGVRLNIIGRRDRLNPELIAIIEQAESLTAKGDQLLLRLAVDYSARDAVAASAHGSDCDCGGSRSARTCFESRLAAATHAVPAGDVDLLIRSGGERRLSDFLLWECAYAELLFVDTFWPDFTEDDLAAAMTDYSRRSRRFGGLPNSRTQPTFSTAP
jgi:undecaprenyl diphosphate synthase